MSHPLSMVLILVALTHLLRGLTRFVGPRWGGLVLGLPYTSALAMAGTGLDQGRHAAAEMATSGLLGLVAAVAVPVGFARAVGRGWGASAAGALGAGCYALIAALGGASGLFGCHAGPLLLLSLGSVLIAAYLARTGPEPDRDGGRAARRDGISPGRAAILRTLVPAGCLSIVLTVRASAGPGWAGLIAPFPGLTLTMLVVTYLESGPGEACRMARVVPASNLGMVAFFGTCGTVAPGWGLGAAMLAGYASAIVGMLAAERWTRAPGSWLPRFGQAGAACRRWAREPRFAPCFEILV
ncbi:MAG: hypothetical protein U0800_07375 [Isosphaeraceae bacterium]